MPVKKIHIEDKQDSLFDEPMRGELLSPDTTAPFHPVYQQNDNVLYVGDSIKWLRSLPSETVDLIFADPPYNIKKADWDKFWENRDGDYLSLASQGKMFICLYYATNCKNCSLRLSTPCNSKRKLSTARF
jgi:hypothetical protein